MSKTIELTFKCERIETYPDDYNKLRVTVELDKYCLKYLISSIEEDELIQYTKNEYDPEGIFSEDQLQKWAEENGYIKE